MPVTPPPITPTSDEMRWVQFMFESIEKQFDSVRGDIIMERENRSQLIASAGEVSKQQLHEVETILALERQMVESTAQAFIANVETRFVDLHKNGSDQQRVLELMLENYRMGHSQQHTTQEKGFDEFKSATNKRIEDTQKSIEQVKDERQHYLLRETYDTQHKTVIDSVDRVERQARDSRTEMDQKLTAMLDSKIKQITDSYDPKLKQITDASELKFTQIVERQARLENGINVGNARNQQSIVALGILLSIVEFIIRYKGG